MDGIKPTDVAVLLELILRPMRIRVGVLLRCALHDVLVRLVNGTNRMA